MALKSDGTVWTWGSISSAGYSSASGVQPSNTPVMVQGLKDVTSIGAGDSYCTALKNDDTVRVWESNDGYQAGDGTNDTFKTAPAEVKFSFNDKATPAGTVPSATETGSPTSNSTKVISPNSNNTTSPGVPSSNNGFLFMVLGLAGLIVLAGGVLYFFYIKK